LLQSTQQSLDSLVEKFARSLLVLIVSKNFEQTIELADFFSDPPNLGEHSLNLVQDGGVLLKRKVMLTKSCNQLREILDALAATNEYLDAAHITNEIRFVMLVFSLFQFLTT